ncbi:hypothetical protein [Saccharothrix deserti]|uniref:hypothetical protein n=1 Tax=Saccharothrix deserti TaxID=2593674 RepID=UPI00131D1718|nr:hypothetical protein [Saccharothrix deserti]
MEHSDQELRNAVVDEFTSWLNREIDRPGSGTKTSLYYFLKADHVAALLLGRTVGTQRAGFEFSTGLFVDRPQDDLNSPLVVDSIRRQAIERVKSATMGEIVGNSSAGDLLLNYFEGNVFLRIDRDGICKAIQWSDIS